MELIISNFGTEVRKKAPEGWNELSLRNQMLVLHIMSTSPGGDFSMGQILNLQRLQIARIILDIQDADLERWEADCIRVNGEAEGAIVFASELNDLLSVADVFYDISTDEAGRMTYAPKLSLTNCPYPALQYGQPMARDRKGQPKGPVRTKALLACANGWENITFYEMCLLFTCVERWAETGDASQVTRALSILYREPKPDTPENRQSGYHNDRRRALLHEEGMVERRMVHLARLPNEVRDLLWYWCRSCRQSLVNRYKRVFSASASEPDALGEAYGWGGVLMELAGGVKDLDVVAQQPATTVLTYLSYLEDKSLVSKLQGK